LRTGFRVRRLSPREAYRLWSETYDTQPNNPVLALEQEIFDDLLSGASIRERDVVDIGCGTGRHWDQLLSHRPRVLHGVDSSPEMLARLAARHPGAALHTRDGRRLREFGDASFDCVVSTLMLGHVRDAQEELREWIRLLKPGGEVIYTDFHPDALLKGAKRTFPYRRRTFEVESYIHDVETLRAMFRLLNLQTIRFEQRTAGPQAQPLVLGFRLRRAA
jgi:ubiquinone/menaquinone biosynthesis C-methylase UbiE